jgi:hypothetical protein
MLMHSCGVSGEHDLFPPIKDLRLIDSVKAIRLEAETENTAPLSRHDVS